MDDSKSMSTQNLSSTGSGSYMFVEVLNCLSWEVRFLSYWSNLRSNVRTDSASVRIRRGCSSGMATGAARTPTVVIEVVTYVSRRLASSLDMAKNVR